MSLSYFVEHNNSQTTQHVQKHSGIRHDIHGDFAKLPELSCYWSDSIGKILMVASPYLYPFCVEYSLICAGMSTKFSHSMLTAWRIVINCLQNPLISMGHVTLEWGTDVVSCSQVISFAAMLSVQGRQRKMQVENHRHSVTDSNF